MSHRLVLIKSKRTLFGGLISWDEVRPGRIVDQTVPDWFIPQVGHKEFHINAGGKSRQTSSVLVRVFRVTPRKTYLRKQYFRRRCRAHQHA